MTHTIPDYAKPYVPETQTDWQLFDSIRYAVKGTTTGVDKSLCLQFLDWWKTINVECFESRLQPLFISREVSSYGHWIGLCQSSPSRHIKLAWAAFTSTHHARAVTKPPFELHDLSDCEFNAAMVILHEMMHQSLSEAGQNSAHESIGWAALCKYLGGALGLPYDYVHLTIKKIPVLDEDGLPLKKEAFDKEGNPILLKNGEPKMVQVRENVRVPAKGYIRDESKPLAPYDAFFCFPYCADDPWIKANTITKMQGKAVANNGGEPVTIPPQF